MKCVKRMETGRALLGLLLRFLEHSNAAPIFKRDIWMIAHGIGVETRWTHGGYLAGQRAGQLAGPLAGCRFGDEAQDGFAVEAEKAVHSS